MFAGLALIWVCVLLFGNCLFSGFDFAIIWLVCLADCWYFGLGLVVWCLGLVWLWLVLWVW